MEEWRVEVIYGTISQQGRKYGKVSRFLKGLNIRLSPRQLKYFYHRTNLAERINEEEMGNPKNYSKLLRSEKIHWE